MQGSRLLANGLLLVIAVMALAQLAVAEESADDRQLTELIEQLGDPQFPIRQRAQEQLIKIGFEAFDALIAAEHHPDPEVAMQAGYLVRQIRAGWTRDNDPRQIREILKDYELLSDEERLAKIKELAAIENDGGLKWLCRLVRFERSPVLSKHAALAIMQQSPVGDDLWERRSAAIRAELERARRPGAKWLEVDLASHTDPAGALPRWSELTAMELDTLSQHPQETHSQIVIALLKREVDLLDQLGRQDETQEVLRKMVLAERGDSASLGELIDWLVKRQAWDVIDLVAERFSASFEVDAVLMYTLCEARLSQGKTELAEETAKRALEIHGDSQQDHVLLANRLGDRGLARWADREWQFAIELGPAGTQWDIAARKLLANSYHDRQQDGQAGELLKQLLDLAEKDQAIMQRVRAAQQQQFEASVNSLRSDMLYYFACQAASDGNTAKQRELLKESLDQNRMNIEALIALYQITGGDARIHDELMQWSKEFVELCRSRIEDEPENPTFYNQIAWLVANTEGNFEEAIELSKRSIELARAQGDAPLRLGGLYDTLSHCYFAKRDYLAAVKSQEEAVRLDPQTHSIRRALEQFRAALKQHQEEKS